MAFHDITIDCPIHDSFRVQQVCGIMDLPPAATSSFRVSAEVPGDDEPWTIGAIVGPSGSGKSTLARAAYGASVAAAQPWPAQAAMIDGFAAELSGRLITRVLESVGFATPPAWIRPYSALSTGERFRCDLARALLSGSTRVVFDEFSSVVDRQVARFASAAVARTVRQRVTTCRQFVAVTCHRDVLEYLEPDWVVDLASGVLARGGLRRPAIELELSRCPRRLWELFRPHHYLSGGLNPAARCYAGSWEGRPIVFCATMGQMGFAGRRRVHRLVVLPDYQGLGVGMAMLGVIASHESATASGVSITTSHPALIRGLQRQERWRATRVSRWGSGQKGLIGRLGRRIGAVGRATVSFRFT